MGTLLKKRYIKQKVAEEDREEGEVFDVKTAVGSDEEEIAVAPRKRRKQVHTDTTNTNAHKKDKKHRVSFNSVPPSIVSIDGLGSQLIQRFRDAIWYTKKDYRTFWKDRVETVRVWHSLYGGIEDDEYVARMLDDTFTIRGLENYVCDPAEAAENLDPKKNRYIQAVLRAQREGRVDAHVLHEEVKDITEASLRKAQALAILDAQAAMPAAAHFAIEPNDRPRMCPVPISPNSVFGIDMNQQPYSRKMKSFDKKLLQNMDEGQRRKLIIEHRRNSVQLYQAEERRKSEIQSQRRLSTLVGGGGLPLRRRQSLSGVPSPSCPPPDAVSGHVMGYGKMMRGHRETAATMERRLSTGTRQPTTLKQHPRLEESPRDSMSLGPRPDRGSIMSGGHQTFFATSGRRLVPAGYPQGICQSMDIRMLSLNHQQRRDSVYGTMIATPPSMASVQMQRIMHRDPSTYTEMIGGFPGMRRDSLASHYEHT